MLTIGLPYLIHPNNSHLANARAGSVVLTGQLSNLHLQDLVNFYNI